MALQSSGQISISDIKTELGSSSGSLTTLSTTAGKSAPHGMKEFYGYTHSSWSNDYALDYDGVNDYVRGSLSSHPSQEFSISMWVRNDESSKRNMGLYCTVHTENNAINGRFLWFYNASFNRLIVQFLKRINGQNRTYQRAYPLHDNSSVTGISNSGTGWVSSQRGNTDSDGFTHLMVCIDQTESLSTNGIKTYWNGNEITSSVGNNAHFTTAQVTHNYLEIGGNYGATAPNTIWDGVIDEVYLYDAKLSASNVSTIYGYGRDSENVFTTNFETAWRMENDVTDENSISSMTNNGATFISSP
jgi:hypothetical protein